MNEDYLYYGALANGGGRMGWSDNTLDFTSGGITDAMSNGQYGVSTFDGVGGKDLGGTNVATQQSWFGDSFGSLDKTLGTIGKGMGAVSSIANVYLGFKALGLAEDELNIKKDQWAMAKQELKHMQATRKRLTASYMGRKSPGGGGGKSW